VVMGGKSGVADHCSVASQIRCAAKSGVTSNLTERGDYADFPAVPAKQWRREIASVRLLGREHGTFKSLVKGAAAAAAAEAAQAAEVEGLRAQVAALAAAVEKLQGGN